MKKTFYHNEFTAEFTDERGYFSLTGTVKGSSGAVGKEISNLDSRFDLVNDLHLSDCKTGEPMYSVENALYFAKKGDISALKNHLRISKEKANQIVKDILFKEKQAEKEGKLIMKDEINRIDCLISQIKESMQIKQGVQLKDIYKSLSKIYSLFYSTEQNQEIINTFQKNKYSGSFQSLENKANLMTRSLEKSRINYLKYPLMYTEACLTYIIRKIVDELKPIWKQEAEEVYKIIEETPSDLTVKADISLNDFSEPEKALALAEFLKIDLSIISEISKDTFSAIGQEYYVLTAEEAEKKAGEYINNYIDECLKIPEDILPYFDKAKYRQDMLKLEDKGNLIASYDGKEIQQKGYFIYRIN